MYEPSVGFYNSVIQAQVRRLEWHGTLTDTDGVAHSFTADNIAADSGRLTRACASATEIALGTVYASQLALGLYVDDIGVDRAKIYGGTITLACTVSAGLISGEVPLGVFTITEALQNGEVCSISAYDAMINFDKPYLGVSGLATPYNWAQNFCTRCGVTLGMDEADFSAFPNGGTDLTLIWNDDIETYRDALSHLAAAIGSVATINRDGELVFLPMESSASVATVKTNDRFDSDIAHTVFTPLTIYLTNAETGEMKSATAGSGNAYLDLGANALLQTDGKLRNAAGQVTDIRTVQTMLNDIIGHAQSFSSVPISAEIPCDPCLDLFDCVTLTGGQAAAGGTVVKITEIETKFGGSTTIGCAGANTAEASTAAERAASQAGGTKDLIMWQSNDSNSEQIIISFAPRTWGDLEPFIWGEIGVNTWGALESGAMEQVLAETTLVVTKDWAKGLLNFTVNYTLDVDAVITYRVLIDNAEEWALEEEQKAGKIVKTISTPVDLWSNTETTPHTFTVTMKGEEVES